MMLELTARPILSPRPHARTLGMARRQATDEGKQIWIYGFVFNQLGDPP